MAESQSEIENTGMLLQVIQRISSHKNTALSTLEIPLPLKVFCNDFKLYAMLKRNYQL